MLNVGKDVLETTDQSAGIGLRIDDGIVRGRISRLTLERWCRPQDLAAAIPCRPQFDIHIETGQLADIDKFRRVEGLRINGEQLTQDCLSGFLAFRKGGAAELSIELGSRQILYCGGIFFCIR